MAIRTDNSNRLQRPGAGLPWLERSAGLLLLKAVSIFLTERFGLKLFQQETERILRLAEGDESYDAFHPLLIPRVIGIEDSSRQWSVMMVLEHLCMTNTDMLNVIKALSDGIVPRGEIDVALYKPTDDVGYDVLDRFRELNRQYVQTINRILESRGNLSTSERYKHPWFGDLSAKQWNFLATLHMRIHRRQIKKIIAMLGVT